ncbi:MAG: hypothetical protein NVSMB65_18720 [Chloroflexota bacterium]
MELAALEDDPEILVDAEGELPAAAKEIDQLAFTPRSNGAYDRVDAIMTTHVVLPALDASLAPADLSRPIISGVIRHELGFGGLIVADSLLMGAVTFHLGVAESAVRAVAAGNDLLLLAQSKYYPVTEMQAALQAVEAAVQSGRIPRSRLDDAVFHVLALKQRLGLLRH